MYKLIDSDACILDRTVSIAKRVNGALSDIDLLENKISEDEFIEVFGFNETRNYLKDILTDMLEDISYIVDKRLELIIDDKQQGE